MKNIFDKEVYVNRRLQLKKLINQGVAVFLGNIESPMNYPDNTYHFRQDSSFLYFFGVDEPGLAAIINFETGDEILFGNDIGIEDIIWMGNLPSVKEKASLVGIKKSLPFSELKKYISNIKGRVHFLPQYRADNKILLGDILGFKPNQLNTNSSMELIKAVIKLRSVKDDYEIKEIEKACEIGYEMHVQAMEMAIEGESEQKISGTIEAIPLKYGGHYSFPVILTQNGQTLHNHDHSGILTKGRFMLTDAGAETAMHYASDFTRTTPVNGEFTQQQKEIYNIVLNANNTAHKLIKPEVKYLDVHLEVAKVIAMGLKDLGLMKGNIDDAVASGAHAMFFPHGLGHMMGLDVHDMEDLGQIHVGYDDETRPVEQFGTAYLRLGKRLKPGYVITNEPGIYFIPALIEKWKSEKINHEYINFANVDKYMNIGGIRLEDDVLVTSTGSRILGKRVPIEIKDIENIVGR